MIPKEKNGGDVFAAHRLECCTTHLNSRHKHSTTQKYGSKGVCVDSPGRFAHSKIVGDIVCVRPTETDRAIGSIRDRTSGPEPFFTSEDDRIRSLVEAAKANPNEFEHVYVLLKYLLSLLGFDEVQIPLHGLVYGLSR